jgi:hypothetical protein
VTSVSGLDLAESARAMARLEGEINKSVDEYSKRPRKKLHRCPREEYRFAQYIEDWRQKVERHRHAKLSRSGAREIIRVLGVDRVDQPRWQPQPRGYQPLFRVSGTRRCRAANRPAGVAIFAVSSRHPTRHGYPRDYPDLVFHPGRSGFRKMTDRYCVLGNPVAHSKSPAIHARFAEQCGQDMQYEAILAPLDGFSATAIAAVRRGRWARRPM